MISKPILFSAPMVRAILEGRKTQTRRIVKPHPDNRIRPFPDEDCEPYWNVGGFRLRSDASNPLKCPHPVGSEMWVKETWGYRGGVFHCGDEKDRFGEADIHYKADDSRARFRVPFDWSAPKLICRCKGGDDYPGQEGPTDEHVAEMKRHWASWRPSIFMPRIFSRLTLKVTDVRVQRLQDISRDDAASEGLSWVMPTYGIPGAAGSWDADPRISYRWLWESINGPGSWAANPFVWKYTFERTA